MEKSENGDKVDLAMISRLIKEKEKRRVVMAGRRGGKTVGLYIDARTTFFREFLTNKKKE